MGIKNLSVLIHEKAPNAYVNITMPSLSGKRVAIDGHNLIYRLFSVHLKEEINKTNILSDEVNRENVVQKWILSFIDHGIMWVENGISPIFVFDGGHLDEKEKTKMKRIELKKKSREKAREILEEIKNNDIFTLEEKKITEAKHHLSMDISLKFDEIKLLQTRLEDFGFPVFVAENDAEQLCSMLALEKKVDAVFSADMDTLTYGCPLLITDIDKYSGSGTILLNCIKMEEILHGFDMNYQTFVDLCIMCGCDYNENIPKVGCKRAFHLMEEFGSIDNLPKTYDIGILNHQRCREIFSYSETGIDDQCMLMKGIKTSQNMKEYKWRENKLLFALKQMPQQSHSPRKYISRPNNVKIVIV